MAAASGGTSAPLKESLREEGHRFDFFQLVRLLLHEAKDTGAIGDDTDPEREPVRFRSSVGLAFAPSDVTEVTDAPEPGGPPQVKVPFFGVASPSSFGSLPTCYSELILERARYKDPVLHEFLDLFNHRLLSLFYRAWEKHKFPFQYERSGAKTGALFEHVLFSLFGMNTSGLRGRMAFPDLALLPWAGALARRPVAGPELEGMISDLFEVPVEILPFTPAWYAVEPDDLEPLGRGGRLGQDFFLGQSVCVGQFRFRIKLGPLSQEAYDRFLPRGDAFRALGDLVQTAVGSEFDFEVQLVMRRDDAPRLRLSREARGNRLGWTTWLQTRPLERDPEDVMLLGSRPAPTTSGGSER